MTKEWFWVIVSGVATAALWWLAVKLHRRDDAWDVTTYPLAVAASGAWGVSLVFALLAYASHLPSGVAK